MDQWHERDQPLGPQLVPDMEPEPQPEPGTWPEHEPEAEPEIVHSVETEGRTPVARRHHRRRRETFVTRVEAAPRITSRGYLSEVIRQRGAAAARC